MKQHFTALFIWYLAILIFAICFGADVLHEINFSRKVLHLLFNHETLPCSNINDLGYADPSPEHKLLVAGLLINTNCLEFAVQTLQFDINYSARNDLIMYQRGQAFWLQGNYEDALVSWRQGHGIANLLYLKANDAIYEGENSEASEYYETAIKIANQPIEQAIYITLYTENIRAILDSSIISNHLTSLAEYFGPETPIGYRVRGQVLLSQGKFQPALEMLLRAKAEGFDDSETWFYIGEAAWQLGRFEQAENAFLQMVYCKQQVRNRYTWYAYRLGKFYLDTHRPVEALDYLLTVPWQNYAPLYDAIAVAYKQLNDFQLATHYCNQAKDLVSVADVLMCEQQ